MDRKRKFNTNYSLMAEHLNYLTTEELLSFELKAKVLGFQDVCTLLCIEISEIPEEELAWAKMAHARGQVDAINTAADSLFSNMNTRNGALASLEYLKATSALFQVDATPISAAKGGGFSFEVNLKSDVSDSNVSVKDDT